MPHLLLSGLSAARGKGVSEGPFFADYTTLKAKIDAESERLRRATQRWLWAARIAWALALVGNVYTFSNNITIGGSLHGLYAGVNATMISFCVFGIMWTTVLWPLITGKMK